MPLLQVLGFLLGLVGKLWLFAAVFCFYTFMSIFACIPFAALATIGVIFIVLFLCWACAKGIYG
jgi:hypothetical protein